MGQNVYELHAHAKQVQRSAGRSSVAAAAYRSAARLVDDRTGLIHDYTKKRGVEHTQIFTPDNAPAWARDREQLWNAAEAKEKRDNACTAHEFEIAFPDGFNIMQRRECGAAIAGEIMNRYGVAVDVAWHEPGSEGDERNYHAHMLFTTRAFDERTKDGWAKKKYRDLSKDYAKDADGKIILDEDGKKQRRGQLEILSLREFTAAEMNRIAERDSIAVKTEHLSFEKRGIDREPTQKLGPYAAELERKGIKSERGDINREIRAVNDNIMGLQDKEQVINLTFERERRRIKEEIKAEKLRISEKLKEDFNRAAAERNKEEQQERTGRAEDRKGFSQASKHEDKSAVPAEDKKAASRPASYGNNAAPQPYGIVADPDERAGLAENPMQDLSLWCDTVLAERQRRNENYRFLQDNGILRPGEYQELHALHGDKDAPRDCSPGAEEKARATGYIDTSPAPDPEKHRHRETIEPPAASAPIAQNRKTNTALDNWVIIRGHKVRSILKDHQIDRHRQDHEAALSALEKQSGFWAWVTGRTRAAKEQVRLKGLNYENALERAADAIRELDKNRPAWAKEKPRTRESPGKAKLGISGTDKQKGAEQSARPPDRAAVPPDKTTTGKKRHAPAQEAPATGRAQAPPEPDIKEQSAGDDVKTRFNAFIEEEKQERQALQQSPQELKQRYDEIMNRDHSQDKTTNDNSRQGPQHDTGYER